MKRILVGAVCAFWLSVPAHALEPIVVETAEVGLINAGDRFKADLEAIGVGRKIEFLQEEFATDLITIQPAATLNISLIAHERDAAGGLPVTDFLVNGTAFSLPEMAFDAAGTSLGNFDLSRPFANIISFRLNTLEMDQPPLAWPELIRAYIRTEDAGKIEGDDIFRQGERVLFSIDDQAMFRVSALPIPEPAT